MISEEKSNQPEELPGFRYRSEKFPIPSGSGWQFLRPLTQILRNPFPENWKHHPTPDLTLSVRYDSNFADMPELIQIFNPILRARSYSAHSFPAVPVRNLQPAEPEPALLPCCSCSKPATCRTRAGSYHAKTAKLRSAPPDIQ